MDLSNNLIPDYWRLYKPINNFFLANISYDNSTSIEYNYQTTISQFLELININVNLTDNVNRNDTGKMTIANVGGGHKKKYRLIDFKREKLNVPATVASIEYDPNRTANIALLHYKDGEKRYIIAPEGLSVGMELISSKDGINLFSSLLN